jgi:hypothetical protein
MSQELSAEGQEKLIDLLSHCFEIMNAFSPGPEGEKSLLELKDDIRSRMDAGDDMDSTVKLVLPLRLVAYMVTASKHMGDMCMAISRMGEQGMLFKE